MPVSGPLGDIVVLPLIIETTQVTFTGRPFVVMYFRGKHWLERLSVLRPGELITAVGQIEVVDKLSVRLDNCELE